MCKIGSPLLSFLLCSPCTPLQAIFFKDGKALDEFGAGRYTLHSQNIPVIRKLVNLPFNGTSPFHCEVYFINKAVSMDIQWKTPTAMPIQDPIYKVIVSMYAKGQFAVRVTDSRKLLLSLVGVIRQFDQQTLVGYFRGILLTNIKDYIIKQFVNEQISFLDIQGKLKNISDGVASYLDLEFEKYGLSLVNFNIYEIEPVQNDASYQKLKQALEKKAEMQVLGYNYQQERAYDFLDIAAANEGTSASLMGAGLGLGMGAGMGNTVGGLVGNMLSEASSGNKLDGTKDECRCPYCQAVVPSDAKFCMACGSKIEKNEKMTCPKCGAIVPKAKFCIACGANLESVCPNCGEEIRETDRFCMSCGQKLK